MTPIWFTNLSIIYEKKYIFRIYIHFFDYLFRFIINIFLLNKKKIYTNLFRIIGILKFFFYKKKKITLEFHLCLAQLRMVLKFIRFCPDFYYFSNPRPLQFYSCIVFPRFAHQVQL